MRSRLARPLSVLLVAVGLVLVLLPGADAAAATRVTDTGWWWRAQTGVGPQIPAPPTVQAGQLMVQGQPEGATAIAAVSADLADGVGNPVLTLRVAENGDQGGEGAVVLACQAGSAWTGGDAASWPSAPSVDCSSSVLGIRSVDGKTFDFPLGPLQFGDELNVIIVPGTVPEAAEGEDGSPFSLVFEKPANTDIATVADAAAPPPSSPSFSPAANEGTTDFESSLPSSGGSSFSTPDTGSGDIAAPPIEPALEPELQGRTATAPVTQASTEGLVPTEPAAFARNPNARWLGLLVVLAGLGTAFLWWRGEGAVPLSALFGGAAAVTALAQVKEPEPVEAGLGRFRRVRTGVPPSLQ